MMVIFITFPLNVPTLAVQKADGIQEITVDVVTRWQLQLQLLFQVRFVVGANQHIPRHTVRNSGS